MSNRIVGPSLHLAHLADLEEIGWKVTKAQGTVYCEAGAVCLEEQNHSLECQLNSEGSIEMSFTLHRIAVTDTMRACYNDLDEAVEWAATGVAFLLLRKCTQYKVIERSCKGKFYDYYLGSDKTELPFNDKACLEVSGIRSGTATRVNSRVQAKLVQIDRRSDKIPGHVIVVEFGRPVAKVVLV